MIIVTLILGVAILTIIFFEIKRLKLSFRFKHLPSVCEFPIIGTTYFFNTFEMKYFDRYMKEMIIAPVSKLFIGPLLVINVADPEIMQEIHQSSAFLERPVFMRFFPYDTGLISALCK